MNFQVEFFLLFFEGRQNANYQQLLLLLFAMQPTPTPYEKGIHLIAPGLVFIKGALNEQQQVIVIVVDS